MLFFQDEQEWLSRAAGGLPDVGARCHTKLSAIGRKGDLTSIPYSAVTTFQLIIPWK